MSGRGVARQLGRRAGAARQPLRRCRRRRIRRRRVRRAGRVRLAEGERGGGEDPGVSDERRGPGDRQGEARRRVCDARWRRALRGVKPGAFGARAEAATTTAPIQAPSSIAAARATPPSSSRRLRRRRRSAPVGDVACECVQLSGSRSAFRARPPQSADGEQFSCKSMARNQRHWTHVARRLGVCAAMTQLRPGSACRRERPPHSLCCEDRSRPTSRRRRSPDAASARRRQTRATDGS